MPTSFHGSNISSHLDAIKSLAKEANQPVEDVQAIYATELARLEAGARISDYLVVLTSKRVRQILRGNS